MVGGPLDCRRLRKYTYLNVVPKIKHRGKAKRTGSTMKVQHELLGKYVVVKPWRGHYIWNEDEDKYIWHC